MFLQQPAKLGVLRPQGRLGIVHTANDCGSRYDRQDGAAPDHYLAAAVHD
jgi:hypothetical protein